MDLGVLAWITGGIAVINIVFYLYFLKFAIAKTDGKQAQSSEPLSVIVCAKNEAENLRILVPKLLGQDYKNFEIILINDYSKDDTLEVMELFQELDSRIKIVNVIPNESFWGNKKYALTLGIKKAIHDKLLFIDADCAPYNSKWISTMASHYDQEKSIVLGYGGYRKEKSFLNTLIRFETGTAAMQYLAYAMHGNAYMGVGRNLSYTATQFYESRGFMSHMKILGGDDDLFINEAATSQNTSVALQPDSFTYSIPKNTWSSWWKQKRRHINTSSHYKWKHKISLGLYHASQFLFLIAAILGLVFTDNWLYYTGLLLLRYAISWTVVGLSLARLQEKGLILLYPVLELILLFSHLGLYLNNLTRRPTHWN